MDNNCSMCHEIFDFNDLICTDDEYDIGYVCFQCYQDLEH